MKESIVVIMIKKERKIKIRVLWKERKSIGLRYVLNGFLIIV